MDLLSIFSLFNVVCKGDCTFAQVPCTGPGLISTLYCSLTSGQVLVPLNTVSYVVITLLNYALEICFKMSNHLEIIRFKNHLNLYFVKDI